MVTNNAYELPAAVFLTLIPHERRIWSYSIKHTQVMWYKYLEMEGKHHEIVRVIEYLHQKRTVWLHLKTHGRLHTGVIVSSDIASTPGTKKKRKVFIRFWDKNVYKAFFMTHICHWFMYTTYKANGVEFTNLRHCTKKAPFVPYSPHLGNDTNCRMNNCDWR